jgi:hypothetical protein
VEATANWYWITDEIEQAGCRPRLVHPRKVKLMMGQINKTDKLDTPHGLNVLQRNGTLPTVWIPPVDWRYWTLLERGTIGVVFRIGTAGAFQRRPHAVRTHPAGCESLFEMGVCGSRQLYGGESPAFSRAACESVVRALTGSQRAQQSGGRSSPTFGGSGVPRIKPSAGLSRSDKHTSGSDQRGVNAIRS